MLYRTLVFFTIHVFWTICGSRSRLSLWIDEKQVNNIIGIDMEIYIISDGKVVPYLQHPEFDKFVIPSKVDTVNLTWEAGHDTFTYWFDELRTLDVKLLYTPLLSIPTSGVIPAGPSIFQISIPCTGKEDGISTLILGLQIFTDKGRPIKGSPMKLTLKKKCDAFVPSTRCKFKCLNGGFCNHLGLCECAQGFHGQSCEKSLCDPSCENNGTCMSPEVCICPDGFSGKRCERALCREPCQHGGRCIQEDVCWCTKGYMGNACQFSKCRPDCKHGGICVGNNKCQCPAAYSGAICETRETERPRRSNQWKRKKKKKKRKNRKGRPRKKSRNKKVRKNSKRRNSKKRKRRKSLLAEVERFSRRQRKKKDRELKKQLDKLKKKEKRRKRRKLFVR
ncbi:wnt inhibitory factor 1-like isoform X1 [Mytilus trossulus]|uniref:wnt inhibitory factor 1-like isoform X1 n=1 Tax=Mytilus trossulus TaxID=6551 RepID=UPI00300442AD